MYFGEKLKLLRTQTGKSQTEVAEEISARFPRFKISQAYLSILEKKKTAPREEFLDVLSRYFDVSTSYFLSDTNLPDEALDRRLAVAEKWIETARSAPTSGKIVARAEGHRREDDEISRSLEEMRRKYQDDDIADF